jgi:hypothetical protein
MRDRHGTISVDSEYNFSNNTTQSVDVLNYGIDRSAYLHG